MGRRSRWVLRALGTIYLVIAGLFLLLNLGLYWHLHGFMELTFALNPMNVSNFIVTVVVLAPGLLLWHFGQEPIAPNSRPVYLAAVKDVDGKKQVVVERDRSNPPLP